MRRPLHSRRGLRAADPCGLWRRQCLSLANAAGREGASVRAEGRGGAMGERSDGAAAAAAESDPGPAAAAAADTCSRARKSPWPTCSARGLSRCSPTARWWAQAAAPAAPSRRLPPVLHTQPTTAGDRGRAAGARTSRQPAAQPERRGRLPQSACQGSASRPAQAPARSRAPLVGSAPRALAAGTASSFAAHPCGQADCPACDSAVRRAELHGARD